MKYLAFLVLNFGVAFSPAVAYELKPLWKEKEYFVYCRCFMIECHLYNLCYLIDESITLTDQEKAEMMDNIEKIRYNIAFED